MERCTGKSKQSGKRCGKWPIKGGTVCEMHGGKIPVVRAKAAERLAEAEVRTLIERLQLPKPLGNPVEALVEVAQEIRAWLEILRERVADLSDFEHFSDKNTTDQARAVVVLYERSLDRAAKVLAELAKLDLDNRLVKIQEKEAEAVVEVIESILAFVPKATREEARSVASKQLLQLVG